jgi:hypothetical protein
MSGLDSDRLFVKKDNLARCAWCGTPESPNWIVNQRGEMFCSSECQSARDSSREINRGFLSACFGGIIVLVPIIAMLRSSIPFGPPIPTGQFESVAIWMMFGFLFLIAGVGGMIAGYEGKKYRDRKDKYNDVTLLQCEYCSQTNSPNRVRCQYCGASLTKAPFRYETTPPWIRKEMHLGRFRCPYCSSIYSYSVSNFENDGSVRCQNCGKPFVPQFPYGQLQKSSAESSLYADA